MQIGANEALLVRLVVYYFSFYQFDPLIAQMDTTSENLTHSEKEEMIKENVRETIEGLMIGFGHGRLRMGE